MKKTIPCHSHSPTNTNRPQKQDDKEEQKEPQTQDDQHAEEPYILQLPDYIIFEIFYKIHIPTIIQCRLVCKSWLRLFSDPYFTKTLCSRTPPSLIVSGRSKDHYLVGLDEASRPNGDVTELYGGNERTLINIVGSCNGLLCLHVNRPHSCRFYLSNPITGESLALPDIYSYPHTCGFGLSPVSNVYKVVFLRTYVGGVEDIMVLTVGSSVWRNIGKYRFSSWNGEDGIYLNGILHWVGMSGLRWVICERVCFSLDVCYLEINVKVLFYMSWFVMTNSLGISRKCRSHSYSLFLILLPLLSLLLLCYLSRLISQ